MKTLKLLLLLGCCTYLCIQCDKYEEQELQDDSIMFDLSQQQRSAKQSKEIKKEKILLYKATMFTSPAGEAPTEMCSFNSPTDFWRMEHQVGRGNATHIGNFLIDLKFCFHIVLNDQGLPDFAGGFGEFTGARSTIEANNGDLLFTQGKGSNLVPIENEDYIFEFTHSIEITGGTGRFKNASGEIINYGKVRKDGSGTDHIQKGSIFLN